MATLPRIGDVERVGALAGGEGALRRNLDAARSERTRAAYASAWRRFCAFAERDDMGTLPADPVIVGLYLSELGETAGPATVRLHAASIAAAHRDAGLEPPTAHPGVKQALRGHARRQCAPPEQVDALDQAAFEAISRTVGKRRASRGGHPETEAEHRERVAVDFALIGLMRDAMLRPRRGRRRHLGRHHLDRGRGRRGVRGALEDRSGRRGRLALPLAVDDERPGPPPGAQGGP